MHLDKEMTLRSTSVWTARFASSIYSAALFLSALLLFAIQPMFAKMVLLRHGCVLDPILVRETECL